MHIARIDIVRGRRGLNANLLLADGEEKEFLDLGLEDLMSEIHRVIDDKR